MTCYGLRVTCRRGGVRRQHPHRLQGDGSGARWASASASGHGGGDRFDAGGVLPGGAGWAQHASDSHSQGFHGRCSGESHGSTDSVSVLDATLAREGHGGPAKRLSEQRIGVLASWSSERTGESVGGAEADEQSIGHRRRFSRILAGAAAMAWGRPEVCLNLAFVGRGRSTLGMHRVVDLEAV